MSLIISSSVRKGDKSPLQHPHMQYNINPPVPLELKTLLQVYSFESS